MFLNQYPSYHLRYIRQTTLVVPNRVEISERCFKLVSLQSYRGLEVKAVIIYANLAAPHHLDPLSRLAPKLVGVVIQRYMVASG
jgi:hypothetical protein